MEQEGQPPPSPPPAPPVIQYIDESGLTVRYRVPVFHYFKRKQLSYRSILILAYSGRSQVNLIWNGPECSFLGGQQKGIQVYVCFIFYLGYVEYDVGHPFNQPNMQVIRKNHATSGEIEEYWWNEARKQLGAHVFVPRDGCIKVICTYLISRNAPQHPYFYTVRGCASMNAIYPVLRCELPSPNPYFLLTLGLYYADYTDVYTNRVVINRVEYERGDRHYSRFRDWNNPSICGNVFEIIEFDFESTMDGWRNKVITDTNYNVFALYVCAGAKLVVHDQYHDDIANIEKHNRSFVQQGGLVVVEGLLELTLFIEPVIRYNLGSARSNGILVGDRDLGQIKNPIIFLAPNESEHQSIAWNLDIQRNRRNNERRNSILMIPEGGRIAAIENWDVGMAEVRARQLYERLHESTVNMTAPNIEPVVPFAVPNDISMLRKMLGMTETEGTNVFRHYDCDIRGDVRNRDVFTHYPRARYDIPKQFNTYKCIEIPDLETFQENVTSAWVPPLYPPIQLDHDKEAQFMPSMETIYGRVRQIQDKYEKVIDPNLLKVNGNQYWIYSLVPNFSFYDYQMRKMDFITKSKTIDGFNSRLGIDGWHYEYVTDVNGDLINLGVKFETHYFRLEDFIGLEELEELE